MHYPKSTLFSILFALVTVSNARHNVTVNNTSPSIQYEGKVGDAPICKLSPGGEFMAGQAGCYNTLSQCAQNASMGMGGTDDAASFAFKGSAIYITSLLNILSPIYTVTLDGNSTDVDGVRPSGAYICDTLFSQTGLDPNVEHIIRLSAKGPSPNRNTSIPNSETRYVFSLLSYTFTEDSDSNSTSTTGGSSQPAGTTTSLPTSSAQTARLSGWGLIAATMVLTWAAVL